MEKLCPRQRICPGQVASSKQKSIFWKKSSAPGSEAVRDKWPPSSKKNQFSAKSSAPGSEAARDKWLLIEKVDILEKVLPQAAKLPRTSGFL